MGTSFSSNSPEKKKITIALIVFAFVVAIVVILGALGGTGMFNSSPNTNSTDSPTNTATISATPVGSLALFSPTTDGKVWTKVFDSMTLPSKCFLDFNRMEQFTPVNLKKILKYQYDNNMLPVDNPFKNIIDIPVIDCSADGSRLILTLDLTKYNGVNPFKQGDALYIYGINGETNANSQTSGRYVFATMNEYPKYIKFPNQIMVGLGNPCNYQGTCSLDNSLILFSAGTYTNGGTVRYVGNAVSGMGLIPDRPQLMYYLYMGYKNNSYNWPFEPMSVEQAYLSYFNNYSGYKQWIANLPQTCTQVDYIDNTAGFVSGPVTVSGGSGSGLQMYIIALNMLGSSIGFFIITKDGTGYKYNDVLNITQGTATGTATITSIDANCVPLQGFSLTPSIYLSYKTSQQQLKNLLDYAMSLDSAINTVIFTSNTTYTVPDNYNNPNITLVFGKTSPDSVFGGISYTGGFSNYSSICLCNGQQDQGFPSNFFPNKINQCANQIVYTSNTVTEPYDFITNATASIGVNCDVSSC